MLYILFIILLFFNSICWADYSFGVDNSVSTGKVIIDGVDITEPDNISLSSIRGNETLEKQQRKISEFTNIDSSGAYDIIFTQDSPSLEVEADQNLLSLINTVQKGDTIHITTNQSFSSSHPIVIRLSSPQLSQAIFRGSGDIVLKSIHGQKLKINFYGAGDLNVSGQVASFFLNVEGTGDINARHLVADNVTINSTGSADINVTAHKMLTIRQTGIGDIVYFGKPTTINTHVTGFGDIDAGD